MTNEKEHFFHVLDLLLWSTCVLPIVLLGCLIYFYVFKNGYMVYKLNKLQTYSLYIFPGIFFFAQIQFYTMDLIYLKGHCTPQHSICMCNILYLIYWWHTGRCSFLLLQTSYCKYWSANIFVYMGESTCRINSWVGPLDQRVRTLRSLWFTFAILLCKELNKLQWHQFGLPCQQRITKLSSLPTHEVKNAVSWYFKFAFIPFTLNEAEDLSTWLNRGSTLKELFPGMSG